MLFNSIVVFIVFFQLGLYFDYIAGALGGDVKGLQVRNCLNEQDYKKYPWPRGSVYEMSAYTVGQPDIETTWDVYTLRNGKEQYIKRKDLRGRLKAFTFEPYELKAGDYKVKVYSVTNNVRKLGNTCFLRIRPEGAMAIITGGTTRTYRPGADIILDGSSSLDFCSSKMKKTLSYKWECTQIQSPGFCANNTGTGRKFVIPGKFVIENDMLKVKLTVENEEKRKSTTYQDLVIKSNSRHLAIWCKDNCPPIVRFPKIRKPLSFGVVCEKHCEEECIAEWAIYKGSVKMETTGACSSVSDCTFKNVFKEPGDYTVTVSCVGKTTSAQASMTFRFQKGPDFTCKLNKEKVTSCDTNYLTCTHNVKEDIEYFEVYGADENSGKKGRFITSWHLPFATNFRIPSDVKRIYVQAFNVNETYSERILPVKVTSCLDGTAEQSQTTKIKSFYFDDEPYSARYSLETKNDAEEAVSKMRSIWDDIFLVKGKGAKINEYRNFIYDLKLHVVRDIEKIPVTTYDRLTQITAILERVILYQTPRKADPLLARSLTGACKKLAHDMKRLLRQNEFPNEVSDKTDFVSNVLLECGLKNSNENYALLTPLPAVEPKEVHPVVPFEETIDEDYDNYEDYDNEYYDNLRNIMEALNNSLRTNMLVAENVVRTLLHNSDAQLRNTDDMKQMVYKHYGHKYSGQFEMDGVKITPSADVLRHRGTVFLSLMVWKRNIFWFSSGKNLPITYIANLDFVNLDTNNPVRVKRPHIITLKMLKKPSKTFQQIVDKVTVPADYGTGKANEEYMEEYVNVHRVNLFQHQSLMVEFQELGENKFKVVAKNFEVPSYSDFKNNFTIFDKNRPSRFYRNDNNYDAWFYIAVLPTRGMLKKAKTNPVSFPYKITVSSATCYGWDYFHNKWTRTCKAGHETNSTHISCECNHLSIISGSKEVVLSRRMLYERMDFNMEVQDFYIIFYCVLSTFAIFCMLLLCTGTQIRSEIYYAADNVYEQQYAYLVVVKSGGHRKTTARVVIKIRGVEGITTHVLNYPDPECKILQYGGEDWIVITTEHCLGNITSIVLWHDDYGIEPVWVCQHIVLYDMQTYEKWFFKINTTISPVHKNIVVAQPTRIKRRLRGVFKDRHSWNMFAEDVYHTTTYITRVTLVYSKLITPLVIVIYWYGYPAFLISDSIDPYTKFTPDWFFAAAAILSGLASFLFHAVIFAMCTRCVTYFIIPVLIAANTILIVYGFWIPHYSSLFIVCAWLLGVFADIIVFENIRRFLKEYVCGTTKVSKVRGIHFGELEKEMMIQREYIYQEVGNTYVRNLEDLHNFKKSEWRKQGIDIQRRLKMRGQVTELLVFGMYLILLYVTVLMSKDTLVVYNHNILLDLVEGSVTRTSPKLSEVNDTSAFYRYINNTLIEGMQSDHWYGDFYVSDPGLLADFNSKFIGVARIRQHRVKESECVPEALPMIFFRDSAPLVKNISCYREFCAKDAEQGNFDGGWDRRTEIVTMNRRLWKMWQYSHVDVTGSSTYRGEFANYPGGGYTSYLGRTKVNSLANFRAMKDGNWIDRRTRSLIIEFLTYNSNYNMFASVLIVLERSATGLVHTIAKVNPVRMIFIRHELENSTIAVSIIFGLWVGIIVLNRTAMIFKRGLIYLRSFWNLLDLIIVGLSVTIIVIYVVKFREIRHVINLLQYSSHREFVAYFHLFNMNDAVKFIGSILVLAATVRLWKLLRFFKMFQIFERTVSFAIAPQLFTLLYHTIVMFIFSVITSIMFGDRLTDFRTMGEAYRSLLRMYLANFHEYDLDEYYALGSSVGVFMICLYMILTKPIMHLYVVYQIIAYFDANLSHPDEDVPYSFIDYVKDETKFLFSVYKNKVKRLRGGVATKSKVHAKHHDIFFANCVTTTTSAINTMSYITMVLLMNLRETTEERGMLTDEEANQMLQVLHYFLVKRSIFGDSKEVFFRAYVHGRDGKRLKFIDHRRMTAAKVIVETMLRTSLERPRDVLIREYEEVIQTTNELLNEAEDKLKKCLQIMNNVKIR